jgi:hypothetical protein
VDKRSRGCLREAEKVLSTSPTLTLTRKQEPLMIYIAATSMVISTAIIVEGEEERHIYKVQRPVYNISEALLDSKTRKPCIRSPDHLLQASTLL